MTGALLAPILALLLALNPGVLAERAAQWPDWHLPAPLERPSTRFGHHDLTYPAWMAGRWQMTSPGLLGGDQTVEVRFEPGADGAVVGDRAFNAASIGRALLGETLLQVANDPANPNRQIARLVGDQQLESTVVGRRSEQPAPADYWSDELALQVLHGPGDPRVSRVETLSHYILQPDGTVQAEQWQASYPSPALGLAAAATGTSQEALTLTLTPLSPGQPPPQSGRAS